MPPQATIGTDPPVAAATSATIRGVSSAERPAREAAATGRQPGLLHGDRVRARRARRAPASTAARARSQHGRAVLVAGERRHLQRAPAASRPFRGRPSSSGRPCAPRRGARARSGCSRSARTRRRGARAARPPSPPPRAPRPRRSRTAAPSARSARQVSRPRPRRRDWAAPSRSRSRPRRRRPHDPRLGVALPRCPGDRPAHDEPEAEPPERVEVTARLVEARRETDRGCGAGSRRGRPRGTDRGERRRSRSHGSGRPSMAVARRCEPREGARRTPGGRRLRTIPSASSRHPRPYASRP